ncbi:MAG: hypothetical protein ACTHKU_15255, partial [Verrucomicrobiota bacterium]
MSALFYQSFLPGSVHFSNDGPLGVYVAEWLRPPASFAGLWDDLNSIGLNVGAWPIMFSSLVRWALGPVGYASFYPPITLFFLGCCVWLFLRTLKFSPWTCG